jgi:lysophospholipase L1-like esterase
LDQDSGASVVRDSAEPATPQPAPLPLPRRRRAARRIARRAVFGALAAAVMLALLECGARVFRTVYVDLHEFKNEMQDRGWARYTPELGWTTRPGYRGPEGGYERSFDDRGFQTIDSPQVADPAARRVLFIGDSNTFGVGTPSDRTFAEVAERLTPGVAAINLGVPGYTSWQGRRLLERVLPELRPAAVVVSFNFNDRKAVLPQFGPDSDQSMRRIWESSNTRRAALGLVLEYSALARVMRDALLRLRPRPVSRIRVDFMTTRVGPESYRDNLRTMAATARKAGVPIVFLILRDSPLYTRELVTGRELLERGDRENALAHLRFAIDQNGPFSEMARLSVASIYREAGLHTSADSVLFTEYPVISVFGGRPIHRDGRYNEIMRAVAAEFDAPLVDAGPTLLAHPIDFTDYCHFDAAGHERVGALIAATLRDVLAHPPAEGPVARR